MSLRSFGSGDEEDEGCDTMASAASTVTDHTADHFSLRTNATHVDDEEEDENCEEAEETSHDADAVDESGDAPTVLLPNAKKKWRRQVSLEEMAYEHATAGVRTMEDLGLHQPLEFAELVHEDGPIRKSLGAANSDHVPTAANTAVTTTFSGGSDPAAIEETAFGLPHVDMGDHRMTRKSSLQMIAAAAREFREMNRGSNINLADPEVAQLVATRHAWWNELWWTVGFTVLFVDAIYVLLSVPLRVGFFYDPWGHKPAREQWTPLLTGFTICDGLGEAARMVFIWRIIRRRATSRSRSSAASSVTATVPKTAAVAVENKSHRDVFERPTSAMAGSMQATEVLSTVTRVTRARTKTNDHLYVVALMLGAIPIEAAVALVNYNWLHVARVGKLLIIGYSLAPAYATLLLKCRRFRWAQWLSFSTLATPFYLFWLGLYLCHVSACGYMLIANIECGLQSQYCAKTPIPGSWVLKDSLEGATLWRSYIRTMYWASKTITTLGQGDMVPTTQWETNYCVVVQYISGLWATSFLASCSFYFSRRDRDIENGVSTRLEQALRFLRSRKVPTSLALQIRNYYQHIQRTRNGIEEDQVLSNLPAHYRSQCSFFVKYRLVAKIPFFAKQPKAFLRSVVDHIESDFLSSKQTILALFEPIELVIVARGDLSVLDQTKLCVRVVGEDEWFGEEALLDDARSKFELEAKNYCEILRLSRPHFVACMEKHFPRLKIAALVAQQKRRMAMIPSTDARLQNVAKDATAVARRTSGRSTIAKVLQQAFSQSEDRNGIHWTHAGSTFRQKWRRVKALLLIFLAVEVPFEVAFQWRVGFTSEDATVSQRGLYLTILAIESFFYVDWYCRVCVFARASDPRALRQRDEMAREPTQRSLRDDLVLAAAAAKARDGVVTAPRDLVLLYLLQNNLWFDVVVNLPVSMVWNFVPQHHFSIATRELMRFARLLSFGRLLVLKRTLRKIMVEHDFSPASQLLANVVVFCVVTANAMACYFYLLADDKDFFDALPLGFDPDRTPLSAAACLDIATQTANCTWFMYDRSTFSIKARYIRAMHWSVVLLSTVGYGDIVSFSNSECLLGFWWIYLGALICYFTSCAVGSVISQVTVLEAAQDARVEQIMRALVRTNVSPAMRVMIRSHYEANWAMNGSALSETSLMEHLPRSLRHQLSASLYVQGVRRCYVFSCLGGQAAMLRAIALLMTSEQFLPGVTIVELGHLASALYLIQSGDVELLLPLDSSSSRLASAVRRRSVLETHRLLQNPFFRFYLRVCATLGLRPRSFSSSGSSHHHGHSGGGGGSSSSSKSQSLGFPVAALKEGDCFGEEGLLADQRSALRISARTLTGTQVASLRRDAFMSLAGQFPVQVRQIVTLISKKQETDMALFGTIRNNFKARPKALEFLGMSPSLYCETKPQVNNVITPDRFFYRAWHAAHGLIILYNFYSITFRLAFVANPSAETMRALTVVDYLMDAFLYADVYLKWNRFGFEEHGDHIVDLLAIRRRYRNGWFRVDCYSLLPTFYYGEHHFAMTLARLPRLVKSLQLLENIAAIESRIREKFMKGSTTLLSVFDLCKFLVFFLSAAHQIGSVYFLLGRLLTEYDVVPKSWMTVDMVINAYPGEIYVQYIRSVYWCLGTFTVVCFGDVISQNAAETVYASSTCVIGWMCIGQIVGRITSLMANIDKDMSDHNAMIDKFEKFARQHQLPQFLRERAIESIDYKSKCLVELNLGATFQDLPPALHAMLFEEMYGASVRSVPELTYVMKPPQLRVLADALTLHVYVIDDIILEEARLGTMLCILREGCAEYFSTKSRVVFAAIHEGQLFGDTAFFIPGARHALSVRATRSCQVLQLTRRAWRELWDEKSRKALEEKFELLALQKTASTELAHANIARNFDCSNNVACVSATSSAAAKLGPVLEHAADATAGGELLRDSFELDPAAAVEGEADRPTQLRSNLKGYTTMLALLNSLVWGRVSRKVAPVLGYRPLRRRSSKKTIVTGTHKLRRSLGMSFTGTLQHIAKSTASSASSEELPSAATPVSLYAQHLETVKARFQQRQERSMFNLNQLATASSAPEKETTTSEIWVDPPLPPSFCLEYSNFRRAWNVVMYLICLYYTLIVPFRVSFDYEFLSGADNQAKIQAWFIVEYLMDLLCVVDFVLHKNYFTFVNRGTLVTERHAIRDHYFREGSYFTDLFCIVPFELLLPFAPLANAPGTNVKVTWYRVAVFRLNKIVRIVHLHELGDKLQRMLVYDVKSSFVWPSVIYFCRFAFDFALGAHWVACMFYGASFNGIDDQHASWLTTPGMLTFEGRQSELQVGQVPVEVKYARSYHFSMGAITTVSYGDIAPQNARETLLGMLVIVVSIVLFGMLSGGFNQMFEMELGQRADYEEKIASVAHFMMFHQFPTHIWKHMQSYFMVHWSESRGMNDDELLSGLPLSVRQDMTLFVKQDFVKQMRLFAGYDESFVRAVVAAFEQELFVRNDVIITYGDRGRSLYVIETGNVLVRIPQSPVVDAPATTSMAQTSAPATATATSTTTATAAPPSTTTTTTRTPSKPGAVSLTADVEVIKGRYDFFGEKSLIFDIPRSATCVALSSCSMLILSVTKYNEIIEEFPEYREKNMRDWIFAHPTTGSKNRAMQAIRRLPTATNARRLRAASTKLASYLDASVASAQPRRRLIRRSPAATPVVVYPPEKTSHSLSHSDSDHTSTASNENAGDHANANAQPEATDEVVDAMGCILTKVCSTDDDDDALLADDLKQHQRLNASMPKRLTRTATQLFGLDPLRSNPPPKLNARPQRGRNGSADRVYYGGGVPGVALDEAALASADWTGAVEGGYTSASGRLKWGAHTRAGCDPLQRRKENQDSFCVADCLANEPNVTLFSVFDGHGPHGAHVSHFVRELYHEKLASAYQEIILQSKTDKNTRKSSVGHDIFGELFQRTAKCVSDALCETAAPATGMDISVSGTTAVAMLVCDHDVFVANVGDSRAVVAEYSSQENKYVVRHVSKDHKPELPEERQRIEAHNGRVYEWGTFRVWLQDVDMPGLAMSRSFGDSIAATIGVASDPDVTFVDKVVHSDVHHPSFAVLASDGVWEFMTTDECVYLVAECLTESKMTPQEACNALVAEATERWNKEEDVVDDITVIVVCF